MESYVSSVSPLIVMSMASALGIVNVLLIFSLFAYAPTSK